MNVYIECGNTIIAALFIDNF